MTYKRWIQLPIAVDLDSEDGACIAGRKIARLHGSADASVVVMVDNLHPRITDAPFHMSSRVLSAGVIDTNNVAYFGRHSSNYVDHPIAHFVARNHHGDARERSFSIQVQFHLNIFFTWSLPVGG